MGIDMDLAMGALFILFGKGSFFFQQPLITL
jgi:hypothetical protein